MFSSEKKQELTLQNARQHCMLKGLTNDGLIVNKLDRLSYIGKLLTKYWPPHQYDNQLTYLGREIPTC